MRLQICIAILFVLFSSFATVWIVSGNKTEIVEKGKVFYVGKVAPGEKAHLIFLRKTRGQKPDYGWDGVYEKEYKIDPDYVHVYLTAPNKEGMFVFNLTFFDQDNLIGPAPRTFSINVTKNAYSFKLLPTYVTAGSETCLPLKIFSESLADSYFNWSLKGIPSSWIFGERFVYVERFSKKEYCLKIKPQEEGIYHVTLSVSGPVSRKLSANIYVYPSLPQKIRATSKGFSLTSILLQPIFSLFGLLS